MPLDFVRYRTLISHDVALAASVFEASDPTLVVPACPDWPLTELRDHMAGTLAFWIHQLRRADADADGPDFTPQVRDRHRLPLTELGEELVGLLANTEADAPCWNWSAAPNRADWAARRMANEMAMHRVDMQSASGIDAITSIAYDLAADGVDELFSTFAGAEDEAAVAGPVLAITIPTRGWAVRVHPELGVAPAEPSEAADVLAGEPSDVVQFLWGRPNRATIEGNGTALEAWRSLPIFS